jgi:hypothetical protein
VRQPEAHLARPVWKLVRFLIDVYRSAIYAVDNLNLGRIISALKDTQRRRQRQANLLC